MYGKGRRTQQEDNRAGRVPAVAPFKPDKFAGRTSNGLRSGDRPASGFGRPPPATDSEAEEQTCTV